MFRTTATPSGREHPLTRRPRAGRTLRTRRPATEALEDRAMPTVLFPPQFGAEHATDNGGLKLNDVPVYVSNRSRAEGDMRIEEHRTA
jgi:hypothetical protein